MGPVERVGAPRPGARGARTERTRRRGPAPGRGSRCGRGTLPGGDPSAPRRGGRLAGRPDRCGGSRGALPFLPGSGARSAGRARRAERGGAVAGSPVGVRGRAGDDRSLDRCARDPRRRARAGDRAAPWCRDRGARGAAAGGRATLAACDGCGGERARRGPPLLHRGGVRAHPGARRGAARRGARPRRPRGSPRRGHRGQRRVADGASCACSSDAAAEPRPNASCARV